MSETPRHELVLEFGRILLEAEWRVVAEQARLLPNVVGLRAEYKGDQPADRPTLAREQLIEKLADTMDPENARALVDAAMSEDRPTLARVPRKTIADAFTILEGLRLAVEWELAPSIKTEIARVAGELPDALTAYDALAQQLQHLELEREGWRAECRRLDGLRQTAEAQLRDIETERHPYTPKEVLQQIRDLNEQLQQAQAALKANGRIDSPEVARVLDTLKQQLEQAQEELADCVADRAQDARVWAAVRAGLERERDEARSISGSVGRLAIWTQHQSTCARVTEAGACSCGLQDAWTDLEALLHPK